jgi:hypothetical protein
MPRGRNMLLGAMLTLGVAKALVSSDSIASAKTSKCFPDLQVKKSLKFMIGSSRFSSLLVLFKFEPLAFETF